ncbi:hypothetical protein HKCCE2091_07335 [Rhodobacterales bacterium HKCCE2091]|nr:hypothetical protein [Rhodobacterales bacterium HKCCE2091]
MSLHEEGIMTGNAQAEFIIDDAAPPGEAEFRAWLSGVPGSVALAVAYRAGLRLFPVAARADERSPVTERLVLMIGRALMAAGTAAKRPGPKARSAAERALRAAVAAAEAAEARVFADPALLSAAAAAGRIDPTEAALSAVRVDDDAHEIARAEAGLDFDALIAGPVIFPPELAHGIADWAVDRVDLLPPTGHLAFWADWHARAVEGRPMSWAMQAEIVDLPDDVWDGELKVLAMRIERIRVRHELIGRLAALDRRIAGAGAEAEEQDGESAAAGFAAIRLIRGPMEDLRNQTVSPKPQPFLVQKAGKTLAAVLSASAKWLGRSMDVDGKDYVRVIGKSGGVATATWIARVEPQVRAVIRAADDWQRLLH